MCICDCWLSLKICCCHYPLHQQSFHFIHAIYQFLHLKPVYSSNNGEVSKYWCYYTVRYCLILFLLFVTLQINYKNLQRRSKVGFSMQNSLKLTAKKYGFKLWQQKLEAISHNTWLKFTNKTAKIFQLLHIMPI